MNRKGKRLGANKVKLMRCRNGQYFITFPRYIVRSKNLSKGTVLNFEDIGDRGVLVTIDGEIR